MKQDIKEVEINGVLYVPKTSVEAILPALVNGLACVILRTQSAGVHYGYLQTREGSEATLINSRRIWYWKGAASLSQLALEGVKNPSECKFSVVVPTITILGVVEIIAVTAIAKRNIEEVPVWKQ